MSKSLETLSEIGDRVGEAAVKAGYGPTIRADAVKKLVDSVVNFQEKSRAIINEMREQATRNSAEIRDAVEDGSAGSPSSRPKAMRFCSRPRRPNPGPQ